MPTVPQSERELISYLDSLEDEAKQLKDEVSKPWDSLVDQYKGHSWKGKRPPHFQANVTEFFVNQKAGMLTESKPDIQVLPNREGLEETAQILEDTIKAIWDEQKVQDAIERAALVSGILGASFFETGWDPLAGGGLGAITVRYRDSRTVMFDPMVVEIGRMSEGQYVIVKEVLPLSEIRKRYPVRGQLVTPEESLGLPVRPHRRTTSPIERTTPSETTSVFGFSRARRKAGDVIPRASITTAYIADDRFDPELNRPAFPGGRRIIRAKDILLADDPNPFWDGVQPIDGLNWDIDPDHAWGRGEVQRLVRVQESLDRLGDSLIRNLLINNNSVTIADLDALDPEEWGKISNLEGLIIKKRPGREYKREAPPVLPPEFFDVPQKLIDIGSGLTGLREVTQGVRPGGITSGVAIEGLQLSALTLVRRVARNLETTLSSVGQKLISRIFQFFDEDRMVMRLGPSDEWQQYSFSRQELLRQLRTDPKTGELLSPADFRKRMRNAFSEFKFLIRPGSSLASSRMQRGLMAVNLLQLGVIPAREVLRVVEWPGDHDTLLQEAAAERAAMGGGGPATGSAQAQRRSMTSMEKLGGT